QAKWSKLELQATKDEILNKLLLLENSYNELLNWQDVNEQLNMLAKNRALYIQQQLIEAYSIPQDKIFIKSSELSDQLHPQVKFGVGQ
ncbi:hypothetical protein MNBD_GAMMA01-667, partial [hydrothermal vent metagenome]